MRLVVVTQSAVKLDSSKQLSAVARPGKTPVSPILWPESYHHSRQYTVLCVQQQELTGDRTSLHKRSLTPHHRTETRREKETQLYSRGDNLPPTQQRDVSHQNEQQIDGQDQV